MNKIVFEGGTGRCGTTILKKVLGAHREMTALPFRHRFIIDPDGLVDFMSAAKYCWSPYAMNARLRRLESLLLDLCFGRQYGRYRGWRLGDIPGFLPLCRTFIESLGEFRYEASWVGSTTHEMSYVSQDTDRLSALVGGFIHEFAGLALDQRGGSVFIDGDTWNALYARELKELCPSSVSIHIVRDPRDVVASMVNQRWCPQDIEAAVEFYKGLMDRICEVRNQDIFVRLEDIVRDPPGILGPACDLIGVDYDPAMEKVDLSKYNSGRWRKEIPGHIADRLTPYVEMLGYEV